MIAYGENIKTVRVAELLEHVVGSRQPENEALGALRYLTALNAIANTVSQTLDLDVILNTALDRTLELVGAEGGAILLVDEEGPTFSHRVHRGLPPQFIEGIAGLALAKGTTGSVAGHRDAVVVGDISLDLGTTWPVVGERGPKAFVCVPLKCKEKVVGVLLVASQGARFFPEEEVQLLTAFGHQLGMVIENVRLYEDLQRKEQMQSQLLRRIISVQEDERRRIARRLHDATSQLLATLAIEFDSLASVPEATMEMKTKLKSLRAALTATSQDVHRLIYEIRPNLLDDLGLACAIRSCVHSSLDPAGVEAHFEAAGREKTIPAHMEAAIFRIAQEAIVNVKRHAKATSAYVTLEFRKNSVFLQVEDDGMGFDPAQLPRLGGLGHWLGLMGMKERAEMQGGKLTIDSRPGNGTRVAVEIPLTTSGQGHV